MLAEHVVLQHGLFTRRQAIGAGYSSSSIGHRVRTGTWESVDYGVYRFAGTPSSWLQQVLAACLAGPAVASHRSAAFLWHLAGVDAPPVEVTALRHRRRHHREGVIWHESRWLANSELRFVSAIPTTSPTRTVIDLAVLGDESLLLMTLDDALRRGLTSIPVLLAQLERFGPRRPGTVLMRRVLDRRFETAVPETRTETAFDDLLRAADLPTPISQFVVVDEEGRFIGRADFAFPEHRLIIEIQSVRFHGAADDRVLDDRRHAAFAAAGFRVIAIWSTDLRDRPSQVAEIIRRALEA